MSLDKCIKRYGEKEGKIRHENFKKTVGSSIDNFIKRYGEKEGKIRHENFRKSAGWSSLKSLIDKYGEEDSKLKYQEVCKMNGKSWKGKNQSQIRQTVSKAEKQFFEELQILLSDYLFIEQKRFYFDETSSTIFVDVYIKELNLIIEYNGSYWHADPRYHHNIDENHRLFNQHGMTLKEKQLSDKSRYENLLKRGFNVMVVWSYDIKKNRLLLLKEISDIIKTNIPKFYCTANNILNVSYKNN
jgi:very-short-patch-repair endonuclease